MKVLLVLCVLCGCAIQGLALDREAFTFTSYDLNVRIEPEQQRLAVRGKITLRNDSGKPQSNLALQISSSLDWRSIRTNSKAAQFITQEYDSDIDHTGSLSEAIVSFPKEIPPNGTVEFEVGYEGTVPLDTSRLTRVGVPQEKAKHADWDQISKTFTAVRGIGYVTWYPVGTEDASLSDGNTVEETIGRWQSKEANAEMLVSLQSTAGTAMFSGTPSAGKATKFSAPQSGLLEPTFVIANYQVLKPADGIRVFYSEGQKDSAEAYADVAARAEPLFKDEHRAADLDVISLPDVEAQPFVTEGMLLTPLTSAMTNQAELAIVYAKARQLSRSPRAWIEDGLAHYAQAKFIEAQKGRQAALDYMKSHASGLVEAEKKADAARSLVTSPDDVFLQVKAMYVWWMLKDMLDKKLTDALLSYQAADDKDISYMPQLIAKDSQRDLQWFFDDWVYHDHGLPDFKVDSVFVTPIQTGGFLVTISIENLGTAGAEVPFVLQTKTTEIRKSLEVRAKSKASIRIETQSEPQQVTVNDGSVPETDTGNNVYKIEGESH